MHVHSSSNIHTDLAKTLAKRKQLFEQYSSPSTNIHVQLCKTISEHKTAMQRVYIKKEIPAEVKAT